MKKLLFVFLLIPTFACIAQQPQYVPKIIPPSPTAAALAKYGDIPVNYSTGVPQIQIPIYELKGKNLSLPIALSYHAGGIKVDEKSGWLGFGWSLSGANGVITRTIRGLPDNDPGAGYNIIFDSLNKSPISKNYRDLIYFGQIDGEPDDHFYNFNGKSGRLFFKKDSVFTIPYENLGFGVTESKATVTTEDGTRYVFGAPEKYQDENNYMYTQSWFLTSITSPLGSERINFDYSDPFVVTEPFQGEQKLMYVHVNNLNGCTPKSPVIQLVSRTYRATKLEKITFENTVLDFYSHHSSNNTQMWLDSLVISEHNKVIKKWVFTYQYDLLYELKEYAVDENGKVDDSIPSHSFEYYSPTVQPWKYARDHWGYFNGAHNNLSLFPVIEGQTSGFHIGANRESSAAEGIQTARTIRSIKYPTGGRTEFEFEANTFYNTGEPNFVALGEKAYMHSAAWDNLMSTSENVESTYSFSLVKDQDLRLELTGMYNNGQGSGSIFDDGQSMSLVIYKVGVTQPLVTFNVPIQDIITQKTLTGRLFAGDYNAKIIITPPQSASAVLTHMSLEVEIIYNQYIVSTTGTTAGGLRVKTITDIDGMSQENNKVRSFQYTTDTPGLEGRSSGVLSVKPYYSYTIGEWRPELPGSTVMEDCKYIAITTGEEAIAGTGSPVYYTEVTVYHGENGANGKSKHYFYGPDTYLSGYPFKPAKVDYKASLLLKTEDFKKNGESFEIVRRAETEYQFNASPNFHGREIQGIKIAVIQVNSLPFDLNPFIIQIHPYKVGTEWFYVKTNKETHYVGGVPTLESTTEFEYTNPKHAQMSRSVRQESDGTVSIKEITYPDDYNNDVNAISLLKQKHMPASVIRMTDKIKKGGNEYYAGGIVNVYSEQPVSAGNVPLLSEVYSLEVQHPLPIEAIPPSTNPFQVDAQYFKKKILFNQYDKKGNILQYTITNNPASAYIWGYDSTRVTAEVKNATYDRVGYASFESDDRGGWSFSGGNAIGGLGNFHTGIKGWQGGTFSKSLPQGDYLITAWIKGAGTVTVNSEAQSGTNQWEYHEWRMHDISSVTVSNSVIIDDLRILPVTASMTTYTYDAGGRLTAVTDPNNLTTFFVYDDFKRLKLIRDADGNIIKRYKYHYAAEQASQQ